MFNDLINKANSFYKKSMEIFKEIDSEDFEDESIKEERFDEGVTISNLRYELDFENLSMETSDGFIEFIVPMVYNGKLTHNDMSLNFTVNGIVNTRTKNDYGNISIASINALDENYDTTIEIKRDDEDFEDNMISEILRITKEDSIEDACIKILFESDSYKESETNIQLDVEEKINEIVYNY